jgi:hypothetical protein
MDHPQTIARVFGVLFLITFITSIPAYFFYVPVLDDPRYIVGSGADTRVSFGALLELLLIIANIGTAVVLYPIVRRQNEILALGYVTARVMECVFIAAGILSLLTVVTLRQEAAAGADGDQMRLCGLAETLGEDGWLKALRLEDYAPRNPRRPGMLQQVLFPHTDAV